MHLRTSRLIPPALALFCAWAQLAQAQAQPPVAAAPAPAPVSVKLALDRTDPPVPVKLAFSIEFAYCIAPGLNTGAPFTRLSPQYFGVPPGPPRNCPGGMRKVGANVDAIVSAFAKDTEYTVTKTDGSHILAFCNAKKCEKEQDRQMWRTIVDTLAKPSPRYFEERSVGAAVAKKLAAAIELITDGAVTGSFLPPAYIRMETDSRLSEDDLANLNAKIAAAILDPTTLNSLKPRDKPVDAQRISLSFFCISTMLSGGDPTPGTHTAACPPGRIEVQANNADQIASELKTDKLKVDADPAKTSVIANCGGEKCDKEKIGLLTSSVAQLSRPSPAYVEDHEVLRETSYAAAASIAKWTNGLITAQVISDHSLRLKSDVRIPQGDVDKLYRRLLDEGFGRPEQPLLQRMFYTDAEAIVSSLSGSEPAVARLAPGVTPPDTSGSAGGSGAPSPTPSPAPSPAPSSIPAGSPSVGSGLAAVSDSIVFNHGPDGAGVTDGQRIRLLTLLDLPKPEVLFNVWSLQESTPDGKSMLRRNESLRERVEQHNEALQNAIDYGWAYLSRQMLSPSYFETSFADYLAKRFVSEEPYCGTAGAAPCLTADQRAGWGLCKAGEYCLGYEGIFQPIKPTLTNLLVGMMAANDPFKTVLTTIGCMGGKFEVYDQECFPSRRGVSGLLPEPAKIPMPAATQSCLAEQRRQFIESQPNADQLGCEVLDRAALEAQRKCNLQPALPLSCFTIQAAKSFVPFHEFSTFPVSALNDLAEIRLADAGRSLGTNNYTSLSATPLGLLRSATADFLFHYKISQEFPLQFSSYALSHSAQQLNALLNPLVVSFNQDVAVFSHDLMDQIELERQSEGFGLFAPFRNYRSTVANSLVTIRGISGLESLVDTETQSAFNAPQFQTLASALGNITGMQTAPTAQPSPGTMTDSTTTTGMNTSSTSSTTTALPAPPAIPGKSLESVITGRLKAASLPVALAAAVSPTAATAQIGRAFVIDVVPHSLPGASSAELEVKLWAQEASSPTLYKDGATAQNDPLSRIARFNAFSRVRVESIKMFEISSFTALVQRPRSKFPLVPPFIEVPVISSFLSLPLPGAKVYHRGTAIVSAIIVPTAFDLAYGIGFTADRAVVPEVGGTFSFRRLRSIGQLPWQQDVFRFHEAKLNCLALREQNAAPAVVSESPYTPRCETLRFSSLPPDRSH